MQKLRFILAAAAACALGACSPDALFKIYYGGTVVINKTLAVSPGATAYFGIETAAAGDCAYVERLEGVQLIEQPSQGEFGATHGAPLPYQVARASREDCGLCLPDWRICYRAAPEARGVDTFSFDYRSATGCIVRYNYIVNIL